MNKELHYKYIISYLLTAIILLLSLAYFEVPDLVDKFSFALTLSSLLLSVLAIFYSIIASNKQDEQFVKVIEANGKLKSSVEDIQSASKAISKLANDIPEHFSRIDGKLTDLSSRYSSMANEDTKVVQSSTKALYAGIGGKELMGMVFRLQFSGMAVLYAFIKSSLHGGILDLEFIDELDGVDGSYSVGVLNGFEVTGLIDFSVHERSIITKYCDKILYEEYRHILGAVVDSVSEKQADRLTKMINQIDEKYT
ncbi:hypothetical protein ACS0KF_002574 [Vibrio vulnificus]